MPATTLGREYLLPGLLFPVMVELEMAAPLRLPVCPFTFALLSDPGGKDVPHESGPPLAARRFSKHRGHPQLGLSGLNHTACVHAVYASQLESPPSHARLASRLLVKLWLGGTRTHWADAQGFIQSC